MKSSVLRHYVYLALQAQKEQLLNLQSDNPQVVALKHKQQGIIAALEAIYAAINDDKVLLSLMIK